MAMRKGRPAKPLSVKKNTLLGYIRSSNHHEIQCASSENDIVAPILDNLIALVAKKGRKHDGNRIRTKTVEDWKTKYDWLVTEKIEGVLRLNCKICRSATKPCKLSTVWAYEGLYYTDFS